MELRAAHQEQRLKDEYRRIAEAQGMDPNMDHPLQYYDYRAALQAGARPDPNAAMHWPSQFKADDHPNRFVETPRGILDSKLGVMRDISTNTGQRVPTPQEDMEKNMQGLRTIGQTINDWTVQVEIDPATGRPTRQSLEEAAKNMAMGYTVPAPMRKFIPEATQKAASAARRAIFRELKKDVKEAPDVLSAGDKARNAWLEITGNVQNKKLNKSQALDQYKRSVRELTSVPDELMERTPKLERVTDSLGTSMRGVSGLAKKYPAGTVIHEFAGHPSTGEAFETVLKMQKRPALATAMRNLPDDIKEVYHKQFLMELQDRSYLYRGGNEKFYKQNHSRWPSEVYSTDLETRLPNWAARNKARPTLGEFQQEIAKPAAEAGDKSFKKHFGKERDLHDQIWNDYFIGK